MMDANERETIAADFAQAGTNLRKVEILIENADLDRAIEMMNETTKTIESLTQSLQAIPSS